MYNYVASYIATQHLIATNIFGIKLVIMSSYSSVIIGAAI